MELGELQSRLNKSRIKVELMQQLKGLGHPCTRYCLSNSDKKSGTLVFHTWFAAFNRGILITGNYAII